jgi:LysM domain-containing protein
LLGTVAGGAGDGKHLFDISLDGEHVFVPGFEHAFESCSSREPGVVAVAYPVAAGPRSRRPQTRPQTRPHTRTEVDRRPAPARGQTGRPRIRQRRHAVEAAAILAAGAVWALGGAMGWLGGGPLAAPGPDPSRAVPATARVYVVQPGDTLWSIARSFQPAGEIRPLVDRLAAEEHGRPLQAGDTLTLP